MSAVILVADDDRRATDLIRLYLERERFQVLVAHDGTRALELARQPTVQLIVLDLMLPEVDGTEICRMLRAEGIDVPIIMLTARTTEEDRVQGFEVGADDYLTKPFSPRELVARIRAVLRRAGQDESTELRFGALSIDAERHEARLHDERLPLTPTEFRLLLALARRPDRPLTRRILAEQAFGYDYAALERTIDRHIANLRRKLERDPARPTCIATVQGVGYKLNLARDVPTPLT